MTEFSVMAQLGILLARPGALIAGATGPATIRVRALAAANPPARQASIRIGRVHRLDRPRWRAPSQAETAAAATASKGHNGGSLFRAK